MTNSPELSQFEHDLEELMPNKTHRNTICFVEAYEVIEMHLERKVAMKTVLEKFNASFGLKVHPARFRQMLEAERTRRKQADLMPAPDDAGEVAP